MYPQSCSFGHWPKLKTNGEGRNKDGPMRDPLQEPRRMSADLVFIHAHILRWHQVQLGSGRINNTFTSVREEEEEGGREELQLAKSP